VRFEGIRKAVQVCQNIRAARGVIVKAYRSRIFVNAATDVKDQDKLMKP